MKAWILSQLEGRILIDNILSKEPINITKDEERLVYEFCSNYGYTWRKEDGQIIKHI